MDKLYSKALTKSNVLFGIHCLFKGILILLLFIILYSIIWIKEKYLNYIKTSVYIQLFIFLSLITMILITNNPNFFDVCFNYTLYIFLIISVLQIIIIILELSGTIKNFHLFTRFFHECPYYRDYNDIIDSKYQRSCLFFNEDSYAEDKYKYLCFFNSEEEYYNKFCDGLLCHSNNKFYNDEKDFTKCTGINVNLIKFPENNIYFQKERILFEKKKNKKIYLCSRKIRMDEVELENGIESKYDIKNIECPDNNPSVKYIVFIYIELILHILVDFLFIIEFFVVRHLNKLYLNMVKSNQSQIPTKIPECHSNSSNNRVNTPSANEIIVNIDKRHLNYPKEINSENDEDVKVEKSPENIEDEKIEDNKYNRRIKRERNDNRHINIINPNQNIKICKDNNDGALLINAIKVPRKRGKIKIKNLIKKQKNVPTRNEVEEYMKDNNKHCYLKSSQLQELINISIDNEENKSSKDDNNNIIQAKIKEKIKNNINELNNNSINNVNEDVKDNNNKIYIQKQIIINDNQNKLEKINHNNINMIIDRNNNNERIISKNSKVDDINLNKHNKSFIGKSVKLLEEKKNMEKKDENEKNINKNNNIIENIHINSEVCLNGEDSEANEEDNKNNIFKNVINYYDKEMI